MQNANVNIYIRKKIGKDKNGNEAYSTIQVKAVSNAFADVYYDRQTKQFRIEYRNAETQEDEKEFKSYEHK